MLPHCGCGKQVTRLRPAQSRVVSALFDFPLLRPGAVYGPHCLLLLKLQAMCGLRIEPRSATGCFRLESRALIAQAPGLDGSAVREGEGGGWAVVLRRKGEEALCHLESTEHFCVRCRNGGSNARDVARWLCGSRPGQFSARHRQKMPDARLSQAYGPPEDRHICRTQRLCSISCRCEKHARHA